MTISGKSALRGLWRISAHPLKPRPCTTHDRLRPIRTPQPDPRWWRVLDEAVSPAEARSGLAAIVADYRAAYPSAMAVIERDAVELVTHLRFPSEHRKRIRSTDESVKSPGAAPGVRSARARGTPD